jgi:hypothetical protein
VALEGRRTDSNAMPCTRIAVFSEVVLTRGSPEASLGAATVRRRSARHLKISRVGELAVYYDHDAAAIPPQRCRTSHRGSNIRDQPVHQLPRNRRMLLIL